VVTRVVVIVMMVLVGVLVAVMMLVLVTVVMRMAVSPVAPCLGLEREQSGVDGETELAAQAVEHVIVRIEHEIGQDLEGYVAIAEVIRRAGQKVRIVRPRARDLFRGRLDAKRPRPVLRLQAVALSEHAAAGQHEPHGLSVRQGEPKPSPASLLVAELDGERELGGLLGRDHASKELHECPQKRK
jgi:hypothetical protein